MPITAHILGGAVMGESPEKGVVGFDGEVHGYPNLYVVAGFLSGVIGGVILASGPIIIIYLTLRGFSKEEFKAAFLLWALIQGCLLIPFYTAAGMLTSKVFLWGLIALPFAGVGLLVGMKLFEKVRVRQFAIEVHQGPKPEYGIEHLKEYFHARGFRAYEAKGAYGMLWAWLPEEK
ncbi:MAG: hypothetical protein DRG87_02950 [Deltaproteobacteria bacterium]|nr:hypothetical protein [Deltaproteobacteria bacterium]RLB31240.1 MAG: hypothetical protein DRG87_02950 [Deltaproteobacteria bacterium]